MGRRVYAVIGAGFGDEGKGAVTDFLCSQSASENTMVVRFNGGAQAGHTVEHDGKRHVFHHFGSGSLHGCSTYLSRHFITNPFLYTKELAELEAIGVKPQIMIDHKSDMTTPYDMLINQALEAKRGSDRHGSCGVGVNETVRRCKTEFKTYTAMGLSPIELKKRLERIRDVWVPQRLDALGISLTHIQQALLHSDEIMNRYLEDAEKMAMFSVVSTLVSQLHHLDLVFEGAQGLGLDQTYGFFPYVTPSNTGLRNIMEICHGLDIGVGAITAVFVSRTYATRHGPGPFSTYDPDKRFQDPTNQPNEFQGTMRFGALDIRQIGNWINIDLGMNSDGSIRIYPTMAITHVDQSWDGGGSFVWKNGPNYEVSDFSGFCNGLSNECPAPLIIGLGAAREKYIYARNYFPPVPVADPV